MIRKSIEWGNIKVGDSLDSWMTGCTIITHPTIDETISNAIKDFKTIHRIIVLTSDVQADIGDSILGEAYIEACKAYNEDDELVNIPSNWMFYESLRELLRQLLDEGFKLGTDWRKAVGLEEA